MLGTEKEGCNRQWMKEKLKTLCTTPKYCGICLESNGILHSLSMEFAINECYITRPLRDIVAILLDCDIDDQTTSDFICEHCTEKTIQSYVFIQNTKKSFKILNYCITDILSKADDLYHELDENNDYENANVMIVLECDAETFNNVNEITTENNIILTDKAIVKEPPKILISNVQTLKADKILKPIIVPTLRKTKHPRVEKPKNVKVKVQKPQTPSVSLEGGKIVITPLLTNSPIVPQYNTYKCNSCTQIFINYKSLKEHEKLVHNTKTFNCQLCNKIYNSRQYLNLHYSKSHSKTRCRICHVIISDTELNEHLKANHKNCVHICTICDLVYYNSETLKAHCKFSHKLIENTNISLIQCVMCFRNLTKEETKDHKCRFSCLECTTNPCIHFSYLKSYREQVLNNATKITCLDCDYTTKRKEHLITHVNREHLDHHPFTCDGCGTQFYTKINLKKHIFQFHSDSKCQYCDQKFVDPKMLDKHKHLCKCVTRQHICHKCVASFDTNDELRTHTKLYHSDIVYPCTLCKKEYITESSLKDHHVRVHSGIQMKNRRRFIECTLCDINFKCTKEMVEHEKLHGPDVRYPCNVCPKRFDNLKQVYLHKQIHYGDKIKCAGCKKFFAPSYIVQHRTSCAYIKSEKLPYVCKVCNKSFYSESLLSRHEQNHASKPCKYCNEMFKPGLLKKHIKQHLCEKGLELKCALCDYTTKKHSFLENHNNRVHFKIKPYVCNVCNKSFCGKERLDYHLRTHRDKYVCCTHCGKKFANKVCLKMHIRRHTGEKPYKCNICSESFRSMSIMKTHRLKKHLDKTIQCPLCESMYHLATEMRFHVKKVHWKRQEPFDYTQIVPKQFHHLFEDQRLQKLGKEHLIVSSDISIR